MRLLLQFGSCQMPLEDRFFGSRLTEAETAHGLSAVAVTILCPPISGSRKWALQGIILVFKGSYSWSFFALGNFPQEWPAESHRVVDAAGGDLAINVELSEYP